MKKSKIKGNLIKILAVVMCLFALSFAMPKKTDAGFITDKIVKKVGDKLEGVLWDAVNLIMNIPDGVLRLMDIYVGGIKEVHRFEADDKEKIYNFTVTPYNIFTSGTYEYDAANDIYYTKFGIMDINFFSNAKIRSAENDAVVSSYELGPVISKVYSNIRNLCIILMMLVLMYLGIRIMISSIAEQQAKYKQLLVDWLVAFSLLFIMHYIMSFIVNINTLVVDMLCNDEGDSYYIADSNGGKISGLRSNWSINKIICRGNKYDFVNGYNTIVDLNEYQNLDNNGEPLDVSDWGNNGQVPISLFVGDSDDDMYRIYKLNTISYIRTASYLAFRGKEAYFLSDGKVVEVDQTIDSFGYGTLYIVLMIETVMFTVIYLKRVIQLAFLTMIAPLVSLMYPIDKVRRWQSAGVQYMV